MKLHKSNLVLYKIITRLLIERVLDKKQDTVSYLFFAQRIYYKTQLLQEKDFY